MTELVFILDRSGSMVLSKEHSLCPKYYGAEASSSP